MRRAAADARARDGPGPAATPKAGQRLPRTLAALPQLMLRASERELREVRRTCRNMRLLSLGIVHDADGALPHQLQTTTCQTHSPNPFTKLWVGAQPQT